MQAAIEHTSLSPKVQEVLASFNEERDEYLDLQKQFSEVFQETNRLEMTAAAFEADAEKANAAWKEMAKARKADQRKINAEIERSVQLKQDAEKFSRTAAVRKELHGEFVIKLSEARFYLAQRVEPVNRVYRGERMNQLLATEGFVDLLHELYKLHSENFFSLLNNSAESWERALAGATFEERKKTSDLAFVEMLERHFHKPSINTKPWHIVSLPGAVKGEIIAQTAGALAKLKKNGGELPLEALGPGAIPSAPAQGLKRVQ
ncbi:MULTISPECIES: hypothetical protein [Pseudomonas]|uniref:Uncharacterized protein n=1 Tax=Pseudomonas lutea TaxID=243924 RepID=A0A9X8QM19_9PSED|nr:MULTISPECIES: hypothetical protein [Pseudomonas]SER48868.1 hypothetical protein SAMN05216409_1282 [Pseudomonas lutea]